jgi:glycosyltransferase involved in cell wall biosynthesis
MVFAQPDPEAIADKLQNLLEDSQKQNQLRNSAYNWINEFSWEKSARIVEAAIIEKLSDTYQDEEK